MKISTVYHTGPVTALCCHDNTILAGIGSFLHVYSIGDGSNKLTEKVLHGRSVHGIRTESSSGETRLCIFGQKCIRLLKYNPANFQVNSLTDAVEFPDWIWDITWLKDDSSLLCLALGHNVVVTYDVARQLVLDDTHCQEKCIIYCAKFLTNHSQQDLILAAGTVFNQVVLWSPAGKVDQAGRRQVIHRLTGHQGVIFSIDYEPVSQRICTASDDRSLILYQVKFAARGRGQGTMTGPPCLEDWETMDCSQLHVLYGHSARVWDVRLLTNMFVSIGEDSTCCVWSYEGHVIRKFRGHKGKSIWSLAVDKGEDSVVTGGGDHSIRLWHLQQGQDGAESDSLETTTMVPLQTETEDFPRSTQMLGMNRVLALTNRGRLLLYDHATGTTNRLMEDPLFASYSVMEASPSGGAIAVGNIHGTVRLFSCSAGQWADVFEADVSLYEGRVFSVHWLDETTLLTTGPDGVIKVCHVGVDMSDRQIICHVTCDLDLPPSKHRWVSAAALGPDHSNIVCGDRMGSVYMYCMEEERQSKKPVQAFPKLHGKAGVTSVCCQGDQVYTTGRDGLYRVFTWTDEQELQLLNSNRVYKGFEWLEKLVIEEEEDIHIHGFHSNMFLVWSIRGNQKLFEVECGGGHRAWGFRCQGNRAQFVYIKSREVILKDVEIRASQTVVKGSLHGRELCDAKRVCSKNSDRAGTCDIVATCSEDTTICVSALTYTNGSPTLRVLHTLSGHISSVRCLSVCPSSLPPTRPGARRSLIFSGGGRAQLRVSRLTVDFQETSDPSETSDSPAKDVPRCNVENLAVVQLGQSGRRRKKPWRHHEEYSDPETRILDTSVVRGQDIGGDVPRQLCFLSAACSDGFVRFFAFDEGRRDIVELSSSSYHDHCVLKTSHLTLPRSHVTSEHVTSDNHLASDHVTSNDHMTTGDHVTSNHVTSDHVTHQSDHVIFLTAATDGSVAFWDTTDLLQKYVCDSSVNTDPTDTVTKEDVTEIGQECGNDKILGLPDNVEKGEGSGAGPQDRGSEIKGAAEIQPIFTLELHQSGINGMHISKLPDGHYMLVTGGDDNAVKVTIVAMDTSKGQVQIKVVARSGNDFAHAAQITGVWNLTPTTILTSSIDQRLCVWSVTRQQQQIHLSMLECRFVDVMDIANIDVWKCRSGHRVLLSGEGLQVLDIDTINLTNQKPAQAAEGQLPK